MSEHGSNEEWGGEAAFKNPSKESHQNHQTQDVHISSRSVFVSQQPSFSRRPFYFR